MAHKIEMWANVPFKRLWYFHGQAYFRGHGLKAQLLFMEKNVMTIKESKYLKFQNAFDNQCGEAPAGAMMLDLKKEASSSLMEVPRV